MGINKCTMIKRNLNKKRTNQEKERYHEVTNLLFSSNRNLRGTGSENNSAGCTSKLEKSSCVNFPEETSACNTRGPISLSQISRFAVLLCK